MEDCAIFVFKRVPGQARKALTWRSDEKRTSSIEQTLVLKKFVIVVDFQLVLFGVGKGQCNVDWCYFACVQFAIGGNKRRRYECEKRYFFFIKVFPIRCVVLVLCQYLSPRMRSPSDRSEPSK